jgi:hypothetical protein
MCNGAERDRVSTMLYGLGRATELFRAARPRGRGPAVACVFVWRSCRGWRAAAKKVRDAEEDPQGSPPLGRLLSPNISHGAAVCWCADAGACGARGSDVRMEFRRGRRSHPGAQEIR